MNSKSILSIRRAADHNETLLEEALLSLPSKESLNHLYQKVSDSLKLGGLVTGVIIEKTGDGILIDICYKSNGLIPNSEFTSTELEALAVKQEIEVLLDKLEDEHGNVVISYQKAKTLKAWDRLTHFLESNEPISVFVTHKVKGGLSVDVGVPAFLPGSQVDTQRVSDFDQFVGQEILCKVIKVNRRRGNVIVSRRRYLESIKSEEKRVALDNIHEGQIIEGVVKNITKYGAFVDIGGLDGLLHITDMSWGRVGHPSELVKIGELLRVKVIAFDKEHEKVSLGIKQLQGNPWENADELYAIGTKLHGKIASIRDYGFFVEIADGIEGLVHISEVSWTEHINNLNKLYQVGQEIEVVVVDLVTELRRMSLSVKRLDQDPWQMVFDTFKVGDQVEGPVSNITDFGIFVQIQAGVDGLVRSSEISWTGHVANPSEKFKKGDVVKAVVLNIDKDNKRISLGMKQLERDPWDTIETDFPLDSVVSGLVAKITSFGAFIRFENGVEGLVHISELSNKEVENVEEYLKVGQTQNLKVVKSSRLDRKLGLSLRAITEPEETSRNQHNTSDKHGASDGESKQKRSQFKSNNSGSNAGGQRGSSSSSKPYRSGGSGSFTDGSSAPSGSLQEALAELKKNRGEGGSSHSDEEKE